MENDATIVLNENENITKKVCKVCGQLLSIDNFKHHARSKDGYKNICNSCFNKNRTKQFNNKNILGITDPSHISELSKFTPQELIDELKRRGYNGTLKYTQIHIINV